THSCALTPTTSIYTIIHTLSSTLLFYFTAPATAEIYTLSLHDALPICPLVFRREVITTIEIRRGNVGHVAANDHLRAGPGGGVRSEEHTSELQSLRHLVCRLLLEKKKQWNTSKT